MEINLKKNLSNPHRLIRLVIGIILLVLVYSRVLYGWWAFLALVLGISQVIEAAYSY